MKDMIAGLLAYVVVQMGGPVPDYDVKVRKYEQQELCQMVAGRPCDAAFGEEVLGTYYLGTGHIGLDQNLDLNDPFPQSILLHELVHYVQDTRLDDYACLGDREREAYEIQIKWLEEKHDIDAFGDGYLHGLWTVSQFMLGCEDGQAWSPGQ
ncbi:MAG: hypothetical protein NXI16_01375 [Alphaproteobacteria bacterium]|nr:hypothetical protein [Alphaproteobacteria bacterium]